MENSKSPLFLMDRTKRFLVYFVGSDNPAFVKIGHCKSNFASRVKQIQNGCPFPITPIGIILCESEEIMRDLEHTLKKKFKKHHSHGEWFKLDTEVSAYINREAQSGTEIYDSDHEMRRKVARERQRERYANDPKYRERKLRDRRKQQPDWRSPEYRKKRNERNRKRYAEDLEYREKRKERNRKRYAEDPECREKRKECNRRYRSNPEYRKKRNERNRKRYAEDLEYREKQIKSSREYQHRKKSVKNRNGTQLMLF